MAENYEYQSILQQMLDAVPDTLDKREGSVIYTALAPAALLLAQQNYMIGYLFNLLFADTSTGGWLDRVVYDFGISRDQATYAQRKITLTDTDGQPMDLPAGTRFAINSLTFALSERKAAGEYFALCEQPGTQGNLYTGELLPVDNLNGLGAAVLAPEPVVAARDAETDDALRERFYQTVRRSPYGGNIADYEQKTLEVDGVGAVQVFAAPVMGPGRVGLVIGDEQGNRASQELVGRVQELMGVNGDGIAPIWHTVTVGTSVDLPVNVAAPVRLRTGASFEIVQPRVEDTVRAYIEDIGFTDQTVFHAKLVAAILGCHESILDVGAVTMNGAAANIALNKTFDSYEVPTIGTITVTEVSA